MSCPRWFLRVGAVLELVATFVQNGQGAVLVSHSIDVMVCMCACIFVHVRNVSVVRGTEYHSVSTSARIQTYICVHLYVCLFMYGHVYVCMCLLYRPGSEEEDGGGGHVGLVIGGVMGGISVIVVLTTLTIVALRKSNRKPGTGRCSCNT